MGHAVVGRRRPRAGESRRSASALARVVRGERRSRGDDSSRRGTTANRFVMVAVFVIGAATLGTVVINVRRNGGKKSSASKFNDEACKPASKARVDGISELLEEMTTKARERSPSWTP